MKKIPITRGGFAKLKRELEILKTVSIPQNIKEIEIARGHGDLSENAEYTAAKERQSYLHGRMQELENNLAMSNVIDLKNLTCEKVVFGTMVAIEEIGTGKGITYQLVGPLGIRPDEEPDFGYLADRRALIGKSVGDEVSVGTPGSIREFADCQNIVQPED